jgi:Fic family protein
MNETIILIPRQKAILNLLAQYGELSREHIATKLLPTFSVSKATLARDLANLLINNQIKATGIGPSRVYQPIFSHPLLKNIDLDQYFVLESDQRKNVSTSFSFDIFDKLPGLINETEQQNLSSIFRSFTKTNKTLNEAIFERELERFIIELAWKSSKIEGNTYSLLETETLLKQNQEAKGHSAQEALMILNHKEAFKLILNNRDSFKKISLSVITELHNVLTKGLSINSGIRKQAVGITGTSYRPLDNEWQIREALEKLVLTINKLTFPLEKALAANSMIAYMQPFIDGNKRTARMLSNAILMAYDYFPLSYRSIDIEEYKKAMIVFYETNNLFHVKRLFLDQYNFAVKTYFV